jgi:hypothetical protein
VLLLYHLLFDTSTEALFNRQKQQLKPVVIARIRERIAYLNSVEKDEKIEGRIAYLEGALNRLNA